MWQQHLSRLMSNSGWGTGFRLPIANAENLELERELERRQRLISAKQEELSDIEKHCTILENGIQNSSDQINHKKKLENAKHAEIAAEKDLLTLSAKESDKLTRECKLTQELFRKAATKNRSLLDELNTRRQDLAELTELIEYDRKELVLIERRSTEEANVLAAIDNISDQDADILKKYETRYRKATAETANLRIELDGKVAMTRVMQTELDGLSERFRKIHGERGDIVSLWKSTLKSLAQRDVDMDEVAESYQVANTELKSETLKVEQEREKLNIRKQSASTASVQLNKWDRKVMDLRQEIKSMGEYEQSLQDDILNYESVIAYDSTKIQDVNRKSFSFDKECTEVNDKVATALAKISELNQKAEETSSKMLTASERMKQIQVLVDEEEKRLEIVVKNLEREMARKGQWIHKRRQLETKSHVLDHEYRGVRSNLQALHAQIKESELTLEKRKATIYRVELQLIATSQKYQPLVNPKARDFEHFEAKESHIADLKIDFERILKKKSFVFNQVNHMTTIIKRIYREKGVLDGENVVLDAKNDDHRCANKFTTKNLELMMNEYKNLIVDHSLVKLKLRQLTKALHQQKNMMYDSEQHRAMLKAAAKEKRVEIEAHSKLLEMKRRSVKEELTQFNLQLSQASSCLARRRKRYEMTIKLMSKADDGNEEEMQSEAYYVLKMAQEREFLRFEGDKWDKKVKDAELETEALQNSLALIQCSNNLFKDSLKPVTDESGVSAELDKLKQQELAYLNLKTKAMSKLATLEAEIKTKLRQIETTQQEKAHYENQGVDKEYELRVLSGELRNQTLSGKRAGMLTNKLLHKLTFSGPGEKELVSQDMKLKATRRKFEFAIQALAKLLTVHPFMYNIMGKLLCQQFGEQVALKFLNRVSPLGDCASPSSSQSGDVKARKATMVPSHFQHRVTIKDPSAITSVMAESRRSLKSGVTVSTMATRSSMYASASTTRSTLAPGMSPTRSTITSAPIRHSRIITQSTVSFGRHITTRMKIGTATSASTASTVSEEIQLVPFDEFGKIPERTETQQQMLRNIATAVEKDRKHVVEERRLNETKEVFGIRKLSTTTESVTETQSSFSHPDTSIPPSTVEIPSEQKSPTASIPSEDSSSDEIKVKSVESTSILTILEAPQPIKISDDDKTTQTKTEDDDTTIAQEESLLEDSPTEKVQDGNRRSVDRKKK